MMTSWGRCYRKGRGTSTYYVCTSDPVYKNLFLTFLFDGILILIQILSQSCSWELHGEVSDVIF